MTNDEHFHDHRILVEGAFMARVNEGEELEELAAVLFDPTDAEMHDDIREAFDPDLDTAVSMPLPGGKPGKHITLQVGVVWREELALLLADASPEVAEALGKPTKLSSAPCVVLANGTASLYRFAIPGLVWVTGGDA